MKRDYIKRSSPQLLSSSAMPISTKLIARIAHADVSMDMPFPRSADHWQRQGDKQRPWKTLREGCGAVLIGKDDGVIIEGMCSHGVSAPDGGVIHIYGDLDSQIEAAGHSEIIITGDVTEGAEIQASGFCHVFVGGDFLGKLAAVDSSWLWVESDFRGVAKTGTPSARIHIGGAYSGRISPLEEAALLWLTVDGLASQESMQAIADCNYTQFHASINRSDAPPGIYPANGRVKTASGSNSFRRWCVLNGDGGAKG
jgi:hypothetical protein